MSYARFGCDGSDVYVFTSTAGLECCGCALEDATAVPVFESNVAMIAHLERHVAAGHVVPDNCLERLRDPKDAAENERIWAGYRTP